MIGQLVARRKDVRSMLKQEKDAGRRAQLDIRQKALKTDEEDKGVFWMAWGDFCKYAACP